MILLNHTRFSMAPLDHMRLPHCYKCKSIEIMFRHLQNCFRLALNRHFQTCKTAANLKNKTLKTRLAKLFQTLHRHCSDLENRLSQHPAPDEKACRHPSSRAGTRPGSKNKAQGLPAGARGPGVRGPGSGGGLPDTALDYLGAFLWVQNKKNWGKII